MQATASDCRRFRFMQLSKFLDRLVSGPPLLMGVLNVTPDSFSDGGLFINPEVATRRAVEMLEQGADIIDIGGQSTRPPGNAYGAGAEVVTLETELQRVVPVIDSILSQCPDVVISIDTVKAEVARRALDAGATIVNDVSGGTQDRNMFSVAAKMKAPLILMHGYGPEFQKASLDDYTYPNVVEQVIAWLSRQIRAAQDAGVSTILADVGIGFAKGAADNIKVLQEHQSFSKLGVPMVLGVSRKSTIGKILSSRYGINTFPPPQERVIGSIAAALYGIANGARIIRTHDVRQTGEAIQVWEALR